MRLLTLLAFIFCAQSQPILSTNMTEMYMSNNVSSVSNITQLVNRIPTENTTVEEVKSTYDGGSTGSASGDTVSLDAPTRILKRKRPIRLRGC
jgi:hypothetical protein